MTRWDRVEGLFERALPLAPDARAALLSEECAGDQELRAELETMLAAMAPLGIERLAPVEPADPMVGTAIGHWRLVEALGRGGMGAVYRAERADGEFHHRAALKLVAPGRWSPTTAERFRTERQVLAQLSHPNIARLFDGGVTDDGRPYLVMELVDGAPITEWCAARGLAVAERLQLFRVVCEAVQHAHGALVVHRDLKPANAFVTDAGDAKLLDFGVAKLLEPAAFGVAPLATREQPAPLTLEYASPEQLFGGAITTATDVYSLGVLLYELVTGARPFRLEGKTPVECEREIAAGAFEPPSRRLGLPRGDDLDSIVLTALCPQPERRYSSAGQLADDVTRYLDGRPVAARPDTLAYRARRFVGRNRAAVAAAVAVAVAVAAFVVIALRQARGAALDRDVAQLERDKAEKVAGLLVELFETSNPSTRPEGDKLSIQQFLGQAEPRVLERLGDEPVLRARMRQVFGRIHAARDELKEAARALEQALVEQRLLLGADDPDAIESQYQLGVLRLQAADEEGGLAILRDVLDRCLRVFGENDERTARTLVALVTERRIAEARPLLERAYAIRRRVLPANHPAIAETLSGLGLYYLRKGDLPRSRELYEQALATFRTPEERRNHIAAMVLNDYGLLLGTMLEFDEAVAVTREAVELSKVVYGPDALQVAHTLHNHAVALTLAGRGANAIEMYIATYDRHRAVLGERHWETVNIQRDVAWMLELGQRHDEALRWFDRALAVVPPDRPEMLHHMRGRRAIVLLRLGRSAEALAELEAVLPSAQRVDLAPYIIADLQIETALVLLELGRGGEAEPHARAARSLGQDKIVSAYASCLLGWSFVEAGRADEGRRLLGEALPTYRAYGASDPRTVAALERVLAAK